jgi:hypothetical protein
MRFFIQGNLWKDCLHDDLCVRFVINIREFQDAGAFEVAETN